MYFIIEINMQYLGVYFMQRSGAVHGSGSRGAAVGFVLRDRRLQSTDSITKYCWFYCQIMEVDLNMVVLSNNGRRFGLLLREGGI